MSCYKCACDHCVYSSELFGDDFTPGEVQDVDLICYTCNECKHYDGDSSKRSQWRESCPKHQYPKKYMQRKETADRKNAEKFAQKCRKAFRVIEGGNQL